MTTLIFDTLSECSLALKRLVDRHIRLAAIIVAAIAVPGALVTLTPSAVGLAAPALDPGLDLYAVRKPLSLTFVDMRGRVLGHQGRPAGSHIKLDQMPAYLPAAFIAMEDRRFYTHHGIDLLGVTRAAYRDLRAGHVVAGGSGISQQTAKLLYDRRERTMGRKMREFINAQTLENALTKQQILEIYLNRLYLGDDAYGVDAAALSYFGVSARQLTLAQAAMLAGLTRAPTIYSPRRDLGQAQRRAALVLAAMVKTGAITPQQAQQAAASPATLVARSTDDHDYVLDAAAEEARQQLGEDPSGEVTVHTTIDLSLQRAATEQTQRMVAQEGRKRGFSQAAVVVLGANGEIRAMVGGVDYSRSVFNRATQAHRQPGSAFKPFVYLAALESGHSPWEQRTDQPVNIAGYHPENYHNASYGSMRLTDALARSVNTIAVNLAQEVGLERVILAARQAGITAPLQPNASLALGTNEVTPLELTAAYATFANGGNHAHPFLISAIESRDGTSLYNHAPQLSQAIGETMVQDMNAMLYNVVTSGTGTAARLGLHEAAGKTGTTQNSRDAWFVGYTADYTTGVWVGNDDNSPMRDVTGGLVPARLWKSVMSVAEDGLPPRPIPKSSQPAELAPLDDMVPAYIDSQDTDAYHIVAVASQPSDGADLPSPWQPVGPDRVTVRAAPARGMPYDQRPYDPRVAYSGESQPDERSAPPMSYARRMAYAAESAPDDLSAPPMPHDRRMAPSRGQDFSPPPPPSPGATFDPPPPSYYDGR